MRTKKSLKNITYALVGQMVGVIVSFVARVIFLNELSTDHLGINNLFLNIIAVMSLTELGIGTAIIFNLYKPLAIGDKEKIKTLMRIYKKIYQVVGLAVLIIGLIISPFVSLLIKDNPDVQDIQLIFVLFVLNASIGYFFSYKKSLLIADQKSYITTYYRYTYYVIYNVMQIFVLIIFQNFILFLVVQIVMNFLENYFISRKVNKLYPFILDKNIEQLDEDSKKILVSNVKALFLHKIGNRLNLSTDNILISTLIGVYWVGIYANYLLIISALHLITEQIIAAITASIGNLKSTTSTSKKASVYQNIYFGNYFLFSIMSICLYFLLNPFIELWIGFEYIFEQSLILLIVINFYLIGMRKANIAFKDAFGLFKQDQFRPLIEAGINIILSILLSWKYGIGGVFLGTIISNLLTSFWIEPYILFKYELKISMKYYLTNFIRLTTITLLTSYLLNKFLNLFDFPNNILGFASLAVIVLVFSTVFVSICLFYTKEFKYFTGLLKNIVLKKY